MSKLALQHTEEVISQGADQELSLDFLQFRRRDYSFFSEPLIRRSINRLQTTNSSSMLHPLDLETVHAQRDEVEYHHEKVIDFPEVFRSRVFGESSVTTLQEWECVVEGISDDEIEAQATSLIDRSPEPHILTIPIIEFSPTDRTKLIRGAVFRLIVGYSKKASGSLARETRCYLRQKSLGLHSAEEFDLSGL